MYLLREGLDWAEPVQALLVPVRQQTVWGSPWHTVAIGDVLDCCVLWQE